MATPRQRHERPVLAPSVEGGPGGTPPGGYDVRFYEEPGKRDDPAQSMYPWLWRQLDATARRAVAKGLARILRLNGRRVIESEVGEKVADDLAVFIVHVPADEHEATTQRRRAAVMVRLCFHQKGRTIVLLAGRDASAAPGARAEQDFLEESRTRYRRWRRAPRSHERGS